MAIGQRYFRDFAGGKRHGIGEWLLLIILVPLSQLYSLVMYLRALAYAAGVFTSYRLARPVISVGNLTLGGTGKTPTVALLARYFIGKGKRVAVLSRGYGGSAGGAIRVVADGRSVLLSPEEAGDEPYLLASSIPGLLLVIGADRYQAGLLAQERFDPDIFILDDGFQHQRLQRDLNLLLLDGQHPFGNGHTLPAGLLREPKSALQRADLVICTRCATDQVPRLPVNVPVCAAAHRLTGVVQLAGGALQPFGALQGRKGLAFAGIADPPAFFSALQENGLLLAATFALTDHARYGETEIAALLRQKSACGADYLITTAKDAVKLQAHLALLGEGYFAQLELALFDLQPLAAALEKLL